MRPRFTYANVMATLAMFVALGGSSYAAVQLSKGQVKTKHLAKSAVKAKKLAPNAVNSGKVKDGSLLAQDFATGQLPAGAQGPQGVQGARGERGPQGDQGVQGSPGLSGYEIVYGSWTAHNTTRLKAATVDCPVGKVPLSAGLGYWSATPSQYNPVVANVRLGVSLEGRSSIVVGYQPETTASWSFQPWVTCARVAS